jgi:hypothetical protein
MSVTIVATGYNNNYSSLNSTLGFRTFKEKLSCLGQIYRPEQLCATVTLEPEEYAINMSRNEDPHIDECFDLEDEGRKLRRNGGISSSSRH